MKMGPHGSRPSPRTERMNAKAAKVAKGAAVAAQLIASLAGTRGGQLCGLSGLCVSSSWARSQPDTSVEQSVAFSEQDAEDAGDRKSTRLNSSHVEISYAVFCLKKKK